jgi:hypothetical protein
MPSAAPHSDRPSWLVLALVAGANFGSFYVYDSIGPVADLLQRERGFSDTQIGWLNLDIATFLCALRLPRGRSP